MRSTLARSETTLLFFETLLVDFFLTSIGLSHGDDSCNVVAAGRVGDHDYPLFEHAQSDQPFLSIVETVVDEGNTRPCQHLFGVGEIQSVFSHVAGVLGLVPFEYQATLYLLL